MRLVLPFIHKSKAFEKRGFQTAAGMKTLDLIKGVNHMLVTNLGGRTLTNYKLPSQDLAPLPAGYVAMWKDDRWIRVCTRPEEKDEFSELPDVYKILLEEDRLHEMELFLCWDQASWDVSASQFLLEAAPGALDEIN